MKWSQLKKRVEALFAPSVQGRVELWSTSYRKGIGSEGNVWLTLDKDPIININYCNDDYFFYAKHDVGNKDEAMPEGLEDFRRWDAHKLLFRYLNSSISQILGAKNYFARAIGMMDARLGKRRLQEMDISGESLLVKRLFYFRCRAEGLDRLVNPEEERQLSQLRPSMRHYWGSNDGPAEDVDEKRLIESKKTRNIKGLIKAICAGKVVREGLDTEISKALYDGFSRSRDKTLLAEYLLHLYSRTKLFSDVRHVRGLIALIEEASGWVRPILDWVPTVKNADRQFSSLARHLFAQFDIPVFMDEAWFGGNKTHRDWFIHLGQGGNIRLARDLPFPLTKREAHFFMNAPDRYTIVAALRWGQVHAMGGNRALADSLLETRLAGDFRDNDFWVTVLQFFIRNPMLDAAHVNPIVDYIWHQKYEDRMVFVERGVAENVGPEQPRFSMRGRTVESLLRQVEAWHGRLAKEATGKDLQWKKSVVPDFQHVEGNKESKNMKIWRIRELLSGQELVEEGREQRHCVATYAKSCASGVCSIWSMEMETEEGVVKLVTIELKNKEKEVRQVRGLRNRLAAEKEKEMLKRWATQNGIGVPDYILR